MENRLAVTGVAQDAHTARIAVLNLKNKPGVAYEVFNALAKKHVDVDMIVQSVQSADDAKTDMIFTVASTDLDDAKQALEELKTTGTITDVVYDDNMAKVSIIGAGMLGTPGIAARMFGALGQAGVNIHIVSTSEISVSCLVSRDDLDKAVKAVHAEFFDKK